MKTCMLCGTSAENDVETCPADGEATWGPVSDAAPSSPPSAPAEGMPVKAKRGARQ